MKGNDSRPDWRSVTLFVVTLIFPGSMIALVFSTAR